MHWRKALTEIAPYKPGKSIEEVQEMYQLKEIIKLASNENPYGQPASAKDIIENPPPLALYPDGDATNLRKLIAQKLDIQTSELLFGSGSDEIIVIIARALLGSGTNTICATPTFPQYQHHARIEGAEVREIPLKTDGSHDLPMFLEAIDENTSVIWLCSPNNPTGTIIDTEALESFLKQVPKNVVVVLDEAYYEYITDSSFKDTTKLFHTYPNVLVLRTFSKAYGLAGIRVGYAIGDASLITPLNIARSPFNVTNISLLIAQKAFEDQTFIDQCRDLNEEQKNRFYTFLDEHQLHYYPSQANFVLMAVPEGYTANEAAERLLKMGYIVRSGDLLGAPGYIRVTIGTEKQNDGFLKAFNRLLK